MRFPNVGLAQLSKSLIRIRGPDATKFLNGLITSRLLPNIVKKKQHTISESEESRNMNLAEIIDVSQNYGLIHEDIYDPDSNINISRDGINSMILNSKGRVVTDCFLYADPFHNLDGVFEKEMELPGFVLEVDSLIQLQLMMLLKLHKLSAKVDIAPDKGLHSYYYYNDTVEFDQWLEEVQYKYFKAQDPVTALQDANSFIKDEIFFNKNIAGNILAFAIDNRIPNFGVKFVTNQPISTNNEEGIPVESVFSDSFKEQFDTTTIGEDGVTKRRFQNGLFETQDAPKGTSLLPFECNLDYINGLSLDKGCYVGQELTIRSFNNGVIRKRIFPVQFFEITNENLEYLVDHPIELDSLDPIVNVFASIPESTVTKLEITPFEEKSEPEPEKPEQAAAAASPFASTRTVRKRKTSVGKLMSRQDNLGLVLFPVADVEKNQFYKLEVPSLQDGHKYIGIKVSIPDWWPE
ncbi:putative transferase CAF17, mitochondrial [Candida viswanathii]|uniref:Putative transferase CAF17, mitochondrial n=1 Tax=Candida viswanathii TaxID=5486 RepID=A0A367YL77_9ASCO|nr:putative transferase CAF17, mitochondrial [Candida viswanathii]